jgi:hypothetical protein
MADTAWVAFGAAMAGAVIGSAATAVAAYAASATERRHNARAKIYLELLPEFRVAGPPNASNVLDEIVRTAVVSGPRCIRRALNMRRAFDRMERPQAASDPVLTSPGGTEYVDRRAEREELDQVIAELDAWLRGRLSPRATWLAPWTWESWPWQ